VVIVVQAEVAEVEEVVVVEEVEEVVVVEEEVVVVEVVEDDVKNFSGVISMEKN
jgi:hypothetical protein